MAFSQDNDNTVDILQHRVVWYLRGNTPYPTELDESQLEHIKSMIRQGFNQGELLKHDTDGEMTHRGWWQIRNCA